MLNWRAHQNVILELGYFIGKLGRERVCVLKSDDVEIPSDVHGVGYTDLDAAGAWQLKLAKELQDAGYVVDLNKALKL
jgi:predicted nucleotide-binding protein